MRELFRGPVPAPFYKHRPLSRDELEACADKCVTEALQRARRSDPRRTHPEHYRHRWEDPRVMACLDGIDALAAPVVRGPVVPGALAFLAPPSPGKEWNLRLWRLAWTVAFATSSATEARHRRALRKAVGRSRTPIARLCRQLLRRDVLSPLRGQLDVFTDALDRAAYQARREFLWGFLREEARPVRGTRWFASARNPIPSDKLEAVARALHQAYPWLPAPDPILPAAGPPPPMTAEQIAAGLTHPDPAAADTARRFGFATPESLRVSRARRRRR